MQSSYFDMMGTKFLNGLIIVIPVVVVSWCWFGSRIPFRGHALHEGFLVSGMLIPLTMPADVPLWMVGLATAFAVS